MKRTCNASDEDLNIKYKNNSDPNFNKNPNKKARLEETCPKKYEAGQINPGSKPVAAAENTSNEKRAFLTEDVIFNVYPKTFVIKKQILCDASLIFYAMLTGEFVEGLSQTPIVLITDIRPEIFSIMLESIKNKGQFPSNLNLTIQDMLEILYAVRKYELVQQEKQLIADIRIQLSSQNALEILPYADHFDLGLIESKCWSFIERETKAVVNSESFIHISWNTLHLLLENNRLTINEYELYLAVLRWSQAEWLRSSSSKSTKKLTIDRMREIIGVAIYKIRFPRMTKGEFALVQNFGILNPGEIMDLQQNFQRNSTFQHTPRKNTCHCRKMKNICLCNAQLQPFISCDLLLLAAHKKSDELILKKLEYLSLSLMKYFNYLAIGKKAMLTKSLECNDADADADDGENNDFLCECMKYLSCPSYPNGFTFVVFARAFGEIQFGPNCNHSKSEVESKLNLLLKKLQSLYFPK